MMDDDQLLLHDFVSDSSDSSQSQNRMNMGSFSPKNYKQISNTSRSLNNIKKGQPQPQQQWQNDDFVHTKQKIVEVQFVPYSIFKEIVNRLEFKLQELEQRFDNREKIQVLNNQLTNIRVKNQVPHHSSSNPQIHDNSINDGSEIKSRSPLCLSGIQDNSTTDQKLKPSPMSQTRIKQQIFKYQPHAKEQSERNISPQTKSITAQGEDALISRLNLFEKRQKVLDEKIQRINKENETIRREYDKKIEISTRRNIDEQDKIKQMKLDLVVKIDELGQNQKAFIQHIHSVGQEINDNASLITTLKEQFELQNRDVTQKLSLYETSYSKNDDNLKDMRNAQNSIENDLFLILRNYKEMLTEVLRVQIISEDIKTLYQIMQEAT